MSVEFEYLSVTFDELPVEKTFDVGGDFTFEFIYNTRYDRITAHVKDAEGNILYSSRLLYGSKFYHAVVDGITFDQNIIPFNISDLVTEFSIDDVSVNAENFGATVKMYLV